MYYQNNSNNFIDRFCAKHPRLGIPNLMMYIGIANVAIYLIDLFAMGRFSLVNLLFFSRDAIFHGQIWRLISFVFVSQSGDFMVRGTGIFFVAICAYFYYWIGSLLEREWGTTKFTLFYVGGVVLNILYGLITGYTDMYFVNLSMFFAMATLYGDARVLLFFIIPVKMKWIAWIDAAFFALNVIASLITLDFVGAFLPIVAILNYLIFFWPTFQFFGAKMKRQADPKVIQFKKAAQARQKAQETKGYMHKCAVCGITDLDDPDMDFRYCSQCDGYYCYCAKHINNHVHIRNG